jgi:hypothetical protein
VGDRDPALGDTGAVPDERRWAVVASCDVPFRVEHRTMSESSPGSGWRLASDGRWYCGYIRSEQGVVVCVGSTGRGTGTLRIGVSNAEPGASLWSPNPRECARCMWACPT